ncbi:hypothetical protein CISIN_1g0374271mg, partial [Citrus sinensis]
AERNPGPYCLKTWPCNGDYQCRIDCSTMYNGEGHCKYVTAIYAPHTCICKYKC